MCVGNNQQVGGKNLDCAHANLGQFAWFRNILGGIDRLSHQRDSWAISEPTSEGLALGVIKGKQHNSKLGTTNNKIKQVGVWCSVLQWGNRTLRCQQEHR